jgi:hypothetical protein
LDQSSVASMATVTNVGSVLPQMKCVSPSRRKTVGSSVIPAGIENSMSALAMVHSLRAVDLSQRDDEEDGAYRQ